MYGTLIVYALNRLLGKIATTIILFAFFVYMSFAMSGIITDILRFGEINKIVSYGFSPLRGLFYIQLGFLLQWNGKLRKIELIVSEKLSGGGKILILILSLCFVFVIPSSLRTVFDVIPELLIIMVCTKNFDKTSEHCKDFTTLRKMSIMIYFLHFAFVGFYRFLYEHGFRAEPEFGMGVFIVTLISCYIVTYIIARLSGKYKILRYLY